MELSIQRLWQKFKLKLFPMAITKRVYVTMLGLIIAPVIILALLHPFESWSMRKDHRGKELYEVAYNLVQRIPGSYQDILTEQGALAQPKSEKIKALNKVLQPIANDVSSLLPHMNLGYYSIELDSVLAAGPGFKDSMLQSIPHDYPYFTVYQTGKPELTYSNRSKFFNEPILIQTFPIYDHGKLVGHAWASYKMQDVTNEILIEVRDIFLMGTVILFAGILLTWRMFSKLRAALKTFANRAADNRLADLHGDFPELSAILEMIQAQNEELLALNNNLKEEVDERLQAEIELSNINDQMSMILESISEAFFALDQEWRFMYFNHEAEILMAKTKDMLLGRVIWEAIPEHESLREKFEQVQTQKAPSHFENYEESSGKWLEIHVYPAKNGLSVFMRDITKRKAADEALRASEQRFYKAFHFSPSLMVITDKANGQILDANESFFTYTGYKRMEIIKELGSLRFCDIFDQCLDASNRGNERNSLRNFEVQFNTKDAQVRYGLAATEEIELSGKECLLVAIIDTTDHKHFENEMLRYERLSLVGQMAAGIGHEIRNPMTTVRGFLQMLSAKPDQQPYQEYFTLMIDELDRTNAIISEFLSLGRNRPVELKMQNLNAIVSALAPLIEADALSGGKSFFLKLEDVPELLLSEKEIRQIILNLARNALEAMEPGGLLSIRTYTEEAEVILAVEDNGPGMPEDVKSRIGTPFFTTKDQGTGLGLAVCYSIAARLQASITVNSAPGCTVFKVKFPASIRE